MGFNPHEKYRASTFDYVIVALAIAVCLGLVAWGLLG